MCSTTSTSSAAGRIPAGLEPAAGTGNIAGMDTHRPQRHPLGAPPVLDMTPDGEFRDPLPPRRTWLDRLLGRIGGLALLATLAAGGLLVASLAVLFVSLLLPVLIGAGLVAGASIWWRMRRAGGSPVRFVVLRR